MEGSGQLLAYLSRAAIKRARRTPSSSACPSHYSSSSVKNAAVRFNSNAGNKNGIVTSARAVTCSLHTSLTRRNTNSNDRGRMNSSLPLNPFNLQSRLLSTSRGLFASDGADSNDSNNDNDGDEQDKKNRISAATEKEQESEVEEPEEQSSIEQNEIRYLDDDYATEDSLVLSRMQNPDRQLMGPADIPDYIPEVLVMPDRTPILPTAFRIATISDPTLKARIKSLVDARTPWVGVFYRKRVSNSDVATSFEDLENTGCVCRINHIQEIESDDGEPTLKVLLQGIRRIQVTEPIEKPDELLMAKVDNATDADFSTDDQRVKAYHNEIVKTLRDIMQINSMFSQSVQSTISQLQPPHLQMGDPASVTDFASALTSANSEEMQDILETLDVLKRLEKVLKLLKREHLQSKLQKDIVKQVEDSVSAKHREHMLREQLKVIKAELGITKDDKDAVSEKFRDRLSGLTVPVDVAEVIEDEMNKMSFLDQNSSEFNVTRNYLDWLTALPWGKTTQENLDLVNAQSTLDEDHYGMADVKDRVLEFIAVATLRGNIQGKILCFVGPPGVGKTSIAKSVARALNREYYRFSVGGLHDVAEIKGHRRTYVGAMPGKLIQCLKKAESENPLVCIDEIDKVGRGHTGDPTSALLELLDPEQNANFLDHYLDVPVDLSRVLFLCTANTTETIPGPLLDRMEVIQVSGYTAKEKIAIAKNYIMPHESELAGIGDGNTVTVTDNAVVSLIEEYCRESGVRSLQKQIQKLYRKSALRIVRDGDDEIEITDGNLSEFVGNPIFTSDRMYETTPEGVVMGLAWTSMGGKALYIETVTVPTSRSNDSGGLITTGQLGDVMQESAQIAYTYAKTMLKQLEPNNDFFHKNQIRMHVPEGATPKDGPSAGVTMTTALLSLALHRPPRQKLAMTGEMSLTGKVLPVGGIKEKILAAKRSGVNYLVLPAGNKTDYNDLDDEIKDGLTVHFSSDYSDLFDKVF